MGKYPTPPVMMTRTGSNLINGMRTLEGFFGNQVQGAIDAPNFIAAGSTQRASGFSFYVNSLASSTLRGV